MLQIHRNNPYTSYDQQYMFYTRGTSHMHHTRERKPKSTIHTQKSLQSLKIGSRKCQIHRRTNHSEKVGTTLQFGNRLFNPLKSPIAPLSHQMIHIKPETP